MKKYPITSSILFFSLLLPWLILSGCTATDISMRASLVKQTTATQAHLLEYECQYVGNVLGGSYWYQFTSETVAHNNALNELLDNAAELGATHVFVNRGNYSDLRGEAYACSYCLLANGKPDISTCLDEEGQHVAGLERLSCQKKGFTWHMRSLDQATCINRDGEWLPDHDNLRITPIPIPTTNQRK